MQYHHDGYVGRDPRIRDAAGTGVDRVEELPDTMDVLIVGAGPAGIVQAAQLTEYPDVHPDHRTPPGSPHSRPGRWAVPPQR